MSSTADPAATPLPPSGDDPLVELVAQALDVLEEGGQPALEAFLEEHPQEAGDIRRRLGLLAESGLGSEDRQQERDLPRRLGDYRLIRPIGGGGMGVVWLAEQVSLGREVALKVVRPDQLLFGGARERFQREVETVARLQHPGIVPVYSVGEEGDVPYFAMEHVQGLSLAQVLEALQGRRAQDLTGADLAALLSEPGQPPQASSSSRLFQGSWHTVCTRIVREVAEALEHARRRGVVHRDVKSSNIMVTRGGRVLLLDFGLSVSVGDERITKTGSAVGSLAYMAPELLDATVEEQDARQDVYSLGATLYELLTLELPFQGKSQTDLLRRILAGDYTPVTRLLPSIPWELATIVQVALDRDPDRRYAHAGAMARDLANVLEHRPIEARPPGALLRARRWVQRHPARAAIAAALVIGPSLLLVREVQNGRLLEDKNREIESANFELQETNQRLADQNTELEHALELARTSFDKALESVDRMLLRVGEHRLAGEPRMDGIRRELVSDALDLYGWFLERADQDGGLRFEVARVALESGHLHGRLGDLEQANAALDRAHSLLGELLAEDPSNLEAILLRGEIDVRQALVLRLDNRLTEAAARLKDSIEGLEGIERSLSPESEDLRSKLLASAWSELGLVRERDGDLDGGYEAFETAVDYLEDLHLQGPEGMRQQYDLARALENSARIAGREALPPGGEPDLERLGPLIEQTQSAVSIYRALAEQDSELTEARFRLGRSLINLSFLHNGNGDHEAGLAASLEAQQIQEELFRDFPDVPIFGSDLAHTLVNLGSFETLGGDSAKGLSLLERALDIFGRTVPLSPKDSDLRRSYATALLNAGSMRQMRGDLEAAASTFETAIEEADAVLALTPNDRTAVRIRWRMGFQLSTVLEKLGHPLDALEVAEILLQNDPGIEEIETYAVLGRSVLREEHDERDLFLDRIAANVAMLVEEGHLQRQALATNRELEKLMRSEGLPESLEFVLGD